MGKYALNVAISVPLSIMIYMLTEKTIMFVTAENKFNEKIQKSFVYAFIIGLLYIAISMTIFSEHSNIYNQSLQYALRGAGFFLVLNSIIINWDDLDEGTKMVLLGMSIMGLVIYTNKTI